jgi:hypothetical protein
MVSGELEYFFPAWKIKMIRKKGVWRKWRGTAAIIAAGGGVCRAASVMR